MKKNYFLIMIVLGFFSCQKEESNTDESPAEVDVYVAGVEYNGSIATAKYWKNGQAMTVGDKVNWSIANSIAVVGNDVYVAGTEVIGPSKQIAKYWKNGQAIALTDGTKIAGATSIAVVGSDIYVAGIVYDGVYANGYPNGIATYWKNGQAIALTDGTKDADASSIVVVGNDVYVAGREYNGPGNVVKYWKNGQPISLTNGTNVGWATSIAIVGNDVYVTGYEREGGVVGSGGVIGVAKYWKNGLPVSLTDGTIDSGASSIAVMGSDIYVVGWENYQGKYWKNGQLILLKGEAAMSFASSIAVLDNDVYLTGIEYRGLVNGSPTGAIAKYLKNGLPVTLTDGLKIVGVSDIEVVKR